MGESKEVVEKPMVGFSEVEIRLNRQHAAECLGCVD